MATTELNLKEAFAGESQANRKYLAFAKKAEQEGFGDHQHHAHGDEGYCAPQVGDDRQHRHVSPGVILTIANGQVPDVIGRPGDNQQTDQHRGPGQICLYDGPAEQRGHPPADRPEQNVGA